MLTSHPTSIPRATEALLIEGAAGISNCLPPPRCGTASTSLDQVRALIVSLPVDGFPNSRRTTCMKKVRFGVASIWLHGTKSGF